MTDTVLLLAGAGSYRTQAFARAAAKLGVRVVLGLDAPPAHAGAEGEVLRLDFRNARRAARQAQALHREQPLAAVLPTDDATVVLAAQIAEALGLRHNSVEAAEAARDKHRMRCRLAEAGVRSPKYLALPADSEAAAAVGKAAEVVGLPMVLKPTRLSGSRGVIRADTLAGAKAAFARTARIVRAAGEAEVMAEAYIPGKEFALEGLLSAGRLTVLALFDKPDPLEGPFFKETIYVTPSRAEPETQAAIVECVAAGAAALGLREGAVHGEARVDPQGAWLVEVAGRSIGGLCGQTLRFTCTRDVSLEELILRQALGGEVGAVERERQAGGVMMIPIPGAGILKGVHGVEAARATLAIEEVAITARVNYPLTPLPEGESYLGFIFARGETPEEVEAALRAAHAQLRIEVEPQLEVMGPPEGTAGR
jgi:biotin carboxylase